MKRIMIVIVAGLTFGVTAAYAAGHAGSAPAQTPNTGSQQTFAVPAASTGTSTESDDPVTHDQGDDQGQDTQPSSEPASSSHDETSQDNESEVEDSQGDDSQGDNSQGENSQGDDSQGDQQGGSQDDGSSGGSGGD
jgi:hypothetical protein